MPTSPFAFDPAPTGPTSRPFRTEMHYFEAYAFCFQHPNWLVNVLLTMVCCIIPVIGPIVVLGYQYELILFKHRRTNQPYPDFDFGRFSNYLTRGIWPFLVQLVMGVILAPIIVIGVFAVVMFVGAISLVQPGQEFMPFVIIAAMMFVMSILQVAASVVITPLTLRAGLTRDFDKAFNMAFVKDFVRRVWMETILALLFLMFTGSILTMLGTLACYIGMLPAMAVIQFAYAHLLWQLYELYLDRGGMPIPLPEDEIILANRA